MQPYINEVIKFAIRQQRPHRHITIESAWEKKYLTWEKKHLSKQEQIDAAEKKMNDSESTLPKLQGWFLKEKHETFKRHQGFILPGQSCNRRWFTIEHASELGHNESSNELLLCYYKLASAEKEQRCGWLFLNDIISLSQDIPNRWITIEHPSRVIRIQSPTPVQHQVWFYYLSKCCKNVQSNMNLSPSTPLPGLPYFSEIVMQKMRKNSLKYAEDPVKGTPKDELDFLIEITGGGKAEVEMIQQNRNLFQGASFSTSVEQDVDIMDHSNSTDDEEEKSYGNNASQKIDFVNLPVHIKILGTISSKTHSLSDSSCNSEALPGTTSCLSVSHADLDQIVLLSSSTSFMECTTTFQQEVPKSMELKHIHGNAATGVDHNDYSLIHASNDSRFDDVLNKNLRKTGCLSNRGEQGQKSCLKTSHHCSINSLSKTPKSSAYQVHFANEDDDKILPDDDFLRSDWDA